MSNLFHHLKSRWDNCRHRHPGYNYWGAGGGLTDRGKVFTLLFQLLGSLGQWAPLLLLRFGMLGQIVSCDQAPLQIISFSKGCQMGECDRYSH